MPRGSLNGSSGCIVPATASFYTTFFKIVEEVKDSGVKAPPCKYVCFNKSYFLSLTNFMDIIRLSQC